MSTSITHAPKPASLAELADRANAEHHAYEATQSAAVAHAIAAGEALHAAKARLKHGEWGAWVAENCEFSERTARRYMRIAAYRTRVADMDSVRAALESLAPKRKPTPEQRFLQQRWQALAKALERRPPAKPRYAYRDDVDPATGMRRPSAWRWAETIQQLEDGMRAVKSLPPLSADMSAKERAAVVGLPRRLRRAAKRIEGLLPEAADDAAETASAE